MAIYLTHGAKKNVGDYLIHSRARKLWAHLRPDLDVVSVPRWEKIELPQDAQALILCGGPGFTSRMIETVFPIAQSALERDIPFSGLALGWQGLPAKSPDGFSMTARSAGALRRAVEAGGPISVRDDVTQRIANQFGIETIRTGCTAWYSVPHLGQAPAISEQDPKSLVFTTPAQMGNAREAVEVMRMLRRRFPNTRLIASFHRGIDRDALTTAKQSRAFRMQAKAAGRLGFEVLDVSYDLAKIGFYREIELHVGYRVHAHLDFVSRRTPSVLISEDGRGYGQTATLHGEEAVLWAGGTHLVDKLDRRLSEEIAEGWPSLLGAVEIIERSYPLMQDVILRQAQLSPLP